MILIFIRAERTSSLVFLRVLFPGAELAFRNCQSRARLEPDEKGIFQYLEKRKLNEE